METRKEKVDLSDDLLGQEKMSLTTEQHLSYVGMEGREGKKILKLDYPISESGSISQLLHDQA